MKNGTFVDGFNQSGISGAGDVQNFHWQKQ